MFSILLMPEDGRLYITRKKTLLNREQKIAFGMVAGFGALALVFGTFYLWKHVASPFVISYTGPKFLTGDESRQKEMETLRKEDTDGDGINDYDELYIYRTSPYIVDSDSDGASDSVEIANGKDPNCAPGMPCDVVNRVNPTTLQDTFIEETVDATSATVVAGAPEIGVVDPSDIGAVLAQMSSEQIRQLLIESGGDAEVVNALSDEELQQALSAALQSLEMESADASDSTISE